MIDEKHTVSVILKESSYDVVISSGIFDQINILCDFKNLQVVIVTNPTVAQRWLQKVKEKIQSTVLKVDVITIPDGEEFKTWGSLDHIFTELLGLKASRKTILIALGGGVIGDITGFAAACYMRGIDFVQMPTTLLAMVDSSVGGKTAINHPMGKNMIGAFHQPKLVIADIDTLATLPEREFKAGLAEIIKHACIADAHYFYWLEENMADLLSRKFGALLFAIKRSVEIKAATVAKDETEQTVRAYLNYGHTFGHAIETGLGYGAWLHGEAVAAGMVAAAHLSEQLGYIDAKVVERIRTLIERAGLPTQLPNMPIERYIELMKIDKKSDAGQLKFILLSALGQACVQEVSVGQAEMSVKHSMHSVLS